MKKLAVLFILSIPALGLSATFSEQLERVTAQALAKTAVQVHVKLAKPVYMSDVMFRRPRGKNIVIRVDYKEQKCTGRLSAEKTHVIVPVSCVQNSKYKAAQVHLTFFNGKQIKKSGKSIEIQDELALVRL